MHPRYAEPMVPERKLCRLDEIPDNCSKGFLPEGGDDQVFAVRRGVEVVVYLNSCPHNWRPLEYMRDRFLSPGGDRIICYAHGAHFDIGSGKCFHGPCEGKSLVPVPVLVENGDVWISSTLPTIFTTPS